MSVRTFWTSFVDGLTGEGLFGDLSIPGFPTQVFKSEETTVQAASEKSSYVLHVYGIVRREDAVIVRQNIETALAEAREGRQVEIEMPPVEGSEGSSYRHAAG